MPTLENWPVEYRKELVLGNLNSSVAICSMWSDREYVAGQVGLENVIVVGNLYSHGPGIEGIIRNVLANPSIRSIVLAGKDKSQSAETLLNFFSQGVEITNKGLVIPRPTSIKPEDLPSGRRSIDNAIPIEALDLLRRNVSVVDMREKSWAEVHEMVLKNEELPAFSEPVVYPKSESKVSVMKGEDIGFVFHGERPEEVWLEILRTIRQFGYIGETQWTSGSQEVLNLVAVLDGDLDQMMKWPGWVGHSSEAVLKYSQQLINGVALDKEDSYAYGERMRVKKGDQIGFLIEQLKKKPQSRSMVIDLWDVEGDWFGRPESPPCLTQAWFRLFQGKLCATFLYRSHDMFGAWIKNAMGDRLLQAYVANQSALPLGRTTIISESAHVYEHDFVEIDRLLKDNPLKWEFIEDPRGNVIITVEDGEIILRHENASGTLTTLKGTSARHLYKEVWGNKLVSTLEHAMYVGFELAKAETSLKENREYKQDRA